MQYQSMTQQSKQPGVYIINGGGGGGTAPSNRTQQQQKHQCSDMERLAYAWHGVETIGMVGLGTGLAVTGVLGEIAACTAGSPLLCVAAAPGAAAAVFVGYKIATSSWQELRTPNNSEFGADCE
jgi:hypothetical protein